MEIRKHREYYQPKVQIKYYNIMIDKKRPSSTCYMETLQTFPSVKKMIIQLITY